MKFVLHPFQGMAHHKPPMAAFSEGLAKHGHTSVWSDTDSQVEGDVDVIWSMKQIKCCINRVLVLECGYINGTSGDYQADRHRFISTSWDDQHGLGLPPPEAPADRWEDLEIELLPWKHKKPKREATALILHQHPGDYMAAPDSSSWPAMMAQIRNAFGRVIERGHPKKTPGQRPLADDLADADQAFTWGSTAAVEAVIAGVPTMTVSPYSIAAEVTARRVKGTPWRGDRLPWCYRLAHRQWTYDDFSNGTAWEWLRYAFTTNYGPQDHLTGRE